jgi:hypothetical protein
MTLPMARVSKVPSSNARTLVATCGMRAILSE